MYFLTFQTLLGSFVQRTFASTISPLSFHQPFPLFCECKGTTFSFQYNTFLNFFLFILNFFITRCNSIFYKDRFSENILFLFLFPDKKSFFEHFLINFLGKNITNHQKIIKKQCISSDIFPRKDANLARIVFPRMVFPRKDANTARNIIPRNVFFTKRHEYGTKWFSFIGRFIHLINWSRLPPCSAAPAALGIGAASFANEASKDELHPKSWTKNQLRRVVYI